MDFDIMYTNKAKNALVLLVGCCVTTSAHAITFTDSSQTNNWTVIQTQATYCVAEHKQKEPNSHVWVGECQANIPHGRGYLIQRGSRHPVVSRQGATVPHHALHDFENNLALQQQADYLADFYSVLFVNQNIAYAPQQSAMYKAGSEFLQKHPNAPQTDRTKIEALIESVEKKSYQSALERVSGDVASSRDIAHFLTTWGDRVSNVEKAEWQKKQVQKEKEEKAEAIRQEKLRQEQLVAEERRRADLQKNACTYLYPGYVGRYDSGTWLSTPDAYVVRYVNADRKTVTIEGTSGGNSLAYGQYLELSCFQLMEKSK